MLESLKGLYIEMLSWFHSNNCCISILNVFWVGINDFPNTTIHLIHDSYKLACNMSSRIINNWAIAFCNFPARFIMIICAWKLSTLQTGSSSVFEMVLPLWISSKETFLMFNSMVLSDQPSEMHLWCNSMDFTSALMPVRVNCVEFQVRFFLLKPNPQASSQYCQSC